MIDFKFLVVWGIGMCLIKVKFYLYLESVSYNGKMKVFVYLVGYGYFCIFFGNVYILSCLGWVNI